jgi:hypothetical protein
MNAMTRWLDRAATRVESPTRPTFSMTKVVLLAGLGLSLAGGVLVLRPARPGAPRTRMVAPADDFELPMAAQYAALDARLVNLASETEACLTHTRITEPLVSAYGLDVSARRLQDVEGTLERMACELDAARADLRTWQADAMQEGRAR